MLRLNLSLAFIAALALAACAPPPQAAPETAAQDFWSEARRGTNSFNQVEDAQHLREAREFGADFVRMTPEKWQGAQRDFLLGNADDYQGLVEADLAHLRTVLDAAAAENVPILLTPISLPGGRWRPNGQGTFDERMWQDRAWWEQTARYWGDIARALKDHPAIVGYNILNEPAPERALDFEDTDAAARDAWCASVRGGPADLDAFNRLIVAAIRAEDPDVPIVLDTGSYGSPLAARCLTAIDDPHVLYSVHMYEPYVYTTHRINAGRFTYPGEVDSWGRVQYWDAAALAAHLQPFLDWADAQGLPRDRLMVGEFGCGRRVPGCATYLGDIVAAAEEAHVHWAFYSFREDVWEGMDYELGDGPPPPGYWAAQERGERFTGPRPPNPMSDVLREALSR